MESDIRNEWGYDVYFISYSSNSRGVAIFFNNDLQLTVHKDIIDDTINFKALDLTIENQRLISIY